MTHPESNGHVTDDVTWPWKVKVMTPICLERNISKTAGERHFVTMTTYRKWPPGNQMVTRPMTSRDPVRSRSWPQYPMGASRDFLTFLWLTPRGQTPPTNLHAKWLKRRGFTQGCAFCSNNRYFSYPMISVAPKRSKFCKFLLYLAFNIRGPEREHPLFFIAAQWKQSGGKRLKYVLKFYIGGTCHVISRIRNDDSALCV